jgi:formiminotetrahydrofolate cyclodeaminase
MTSSDAGSSIEAWTLALARPTIAPAGGSAAAITGAMAASLVGMVAGVTIERKRYAAAHAEAARIRNAAERLRSELLELASEDARVFADFGDALKLPTGTDRERLTRDAAKRQALVEGARVQLEIVRRAAEIAEMGEHVAGVAPPSTVGDAATATFLATAAVRSAYWAARIDLEHDTDVGRDLLGLAEAAQRRLADLLAERVR